MAPPNLDRARKAYELIRVFPGIDAGTLKIMLGITHFAVLSTLMVCEWNSMLLSEDDSNGLYVWRG